jgi:hypothetical protein
LQERSGGSSIRPGGGVAGGVAGAGASVQEHVASSVTLPAGQAVMHLSPPAQATVPAGQTQVQLPLWVCPSGQVPAQTQAHEPSRIAPAAHATQVSLARQILVLLGQVHRHRASWVLPPVHFATHVPLHSVMPLGQTHWQLLTWPAERQTHWQLTSLRTWPLGHAAMQRPSQRSRGAGQGPQSPPGGHAASASSAPNRPSIPASATPARAFSASRRVLRRPTSRWYRAAFHPLRDSFSHPIEFPAPACRELQRQRSGTSRACAWERRSTWGGVP